MPITGEVSVGGAGYMGIGLETTLGEFASPTKWFPIRSETFDKNSPPIYRMNLRGKADRTGAVPGYINASGEVVFEVSSDVLPYIMAASRMTITKSGTAPTTYVGTPIHVAKTKTEASGGGLLGRKTLTLYIVRAEVPFAVLGASISQMAFTLDNGLLVCTATVVGTDQQDGVDDPTNLSTPATPDFSDNALPFGPGDITLEIPTGNTRVDVDTFNFTINDNAVAQNRLTGSRAAAYINWGEREITATADHDFEDTQDYDDFVAVTEKDVNFTAIHSADDSLTVYFGAAIADNYPVHLSALGDVTRASVNYHGIADDAFNNGDAYTMTCVSSEDIS